MGRLVIFTHYVDDNIYHDIITGISITGILHFINQIRIICFYKKQATVEMATYGSEFVAVPECLEHVIDLRNTLQYLDVPIVGPSYIFVDNEYVLMNIRAKLHKQHSALLFYSVKEAVATGI